MKRDAAPKSRVWQSGWTLVELLVAMTLSLLLIAGIGQIYLAAKHSYNLQNNIAQIQEVGRYVSDTLAYDIRMAGYWGLMDIHYATASPGNDGPPPTGDDFFLTGTVAPGGCPGPSSTAWGRMVTQRVFGLDDTSAGYSCIGDRLRGDILTVRYANPTAVSGVSGTDLFIHTAPFQGSLTGPGLSDYVTDPVSSLHLVEANAYYVAAPITTECGNVPVLAREHLSSSRTPVKESLVNGVEQLQFQYGVDTDGDGSVNQYMDANVVPNWGNVLAVRFWVLVRADCPDSSYTDASTYQMGSFPYTPAASDQQYRRALFSSTVFLRNR